MGSAYRFKCKGCGLTAEVSGGHDAGFVIETSTVWCAACSTLQDFMIQKDCANSVFDSGDEENWIQLEQVCHKCKSHALNTWYAGYPCPKRTGIVVKLREAVEFRD